MQQPLFPSEKPGASLAAQMICPVCKRQADAIWGDVLRCDECHLEDYQSPLQALR